MKIIFLKKPLFENKWRPKRKMIKRTLVDFRKKLSFYHEVNFSIRTRRTLPNGVFFLKIFPRKIENLKWFKGDTGNEFVYIKKEFTDEYGNGLVEPISFKNFYSNSVKFYPIFDCDYKFISNQKDVNKKMRVILIDWLIDVHTRFKLYPRTLYLTINIIHRFLGNKHIARQKLQLLGITSMLLASKYEEIYAPETKDFVYITDSAYTREDIFRMENLICNSLKFKFSYPNPQIILCIYLKLMEATMDCVILSTYIFEMTLLEPYFMKTDFIPLIRSIMLCAYQISEKRENVNRSEELIYFLKKLAPFQGHEPSVFKVSRGLLVNGQNDKNKLSSIKRKFLSKKYRELGKSHFSIKIKFNESDNDLSQNQFMYFSP